MPTVSDVLSISQSIYAPAIFSLTLLFVSASFLDSTRMVKDLVGKVESLVLAQASDKHNLTRLVVIVFLFFLSPMIYDIIGSFSPVSLSHSLSSATIYPDDKTRLAQIWCSFPALLDQSMLEAFVRSAASDHAGDSVNVLFNDRTNASATYFHHTTTAAILLLLSLVVSVFSRKYRQVKIVPLAFSLAAIVGIGIQSAAEQGAAHRAVARDITISAHSRLLAGGKISAPSVECVRAKQAEFASSSRATPMRIHLRVPRIYSIIPVNPPRKRD